MKTELFLYTKEELIEFLRSVLANYYMQTINKKELSDSLRVNNFNWHSFSNNTITGTYYGKKVSVLVKHTRFTTTVVIVKWW